MNKRIKAIGDLITLEDKVIDVGCDNALLSKYLAKKGIKSIATDLRKNIIDNSITSTPESLRKYIDFRVGDGLSVVKEKDNINLVVLSGMGTSLILNILNGYEYEKIITVSNNNYYELRKEMSKRDYEIHLEQIIYEKGKYYNLIYFKKGHKNYNEKELILGVNHIDKESLEEYKKYLLKKYNKILLQVPNKEKIEKVISIIKED